MMFSWIWYHSLSLLHLKVELSGHLKSANSVSMRACVCVCVRQEAERNSHVHFEYKVFLVFQLGDGLQDVAHGENSAAVRPAVSDVRGTFFVVVQRHSPCNDSLCVCVRACNVDMFPVLCLFTCANHL